MKNIFTLLVISLGITSAAHAGLLIEPYMGYSFGEADYKYTSAYGGGPSYSDTLTGAGYGLRLGYKIIFPWIALDYTGSSGGGKNGVPGARNYDYKATALGAVVGVDLPFFMRVWAGYGLTNDVTITTPGLSDAELKGTYTKAGLGFDFIPFLSINAEYQMNNFTKADAGDGKGEQDSSVIYSSMANNMVLISISCPIDL